MKHRIIFIHYFLFICFETLNGNDFSVSGYVLDKSTGSPLVGANIFLESTSIGTASNEEGYYNIKNIKKGNYSINVSYIGYSQFSDSLLISGNENNIKLDIFLRYAAIEGEEINVTAQAKGQIDAINKQLNSKSLVNIISSDRIQELPDANAAETVARVPGVSIRREGGEGNKVIVRGLSPKYNNITVDGVKIASTDSENRSADLSMISQYMLEGIEVTKAGTPDQDADALGGTVNFQLKKAKQGFHGNIIVQGMHNGLRDTYDDNKMVLALSQRFFENKIGVLGQVDFENRNRSSNEFGSSYTVNGASIDTLNPLRLEGLNLNDWHRFNDRQNILQVYDFLIPDGNISYSFLKSNIEKDIIRYTTSYALPVNNKNMNALKGANLIEVFTKSFRYEQKLLSKYHLDAFYSISQSKNKEEFYDFNFTEQFAYDSSTYNKSIEIIQQIAKNDLSNTHFGTYDYNFNMSNEKDKTSGFNLNFDFRISDNISGNIKFGHKARIKDRVYDRHNEFLMASNGYGSDEVIEYLGIEEFAADQSETRIPFLGLIDNDYENEPFFNGRYSFDAVADLDIMMKLYDWFNKKLE